RSCGQSQRLRADLTPDRPRRGFRPGHKRARFEGAARLAGARVKCLVAIPRPPSATATFGRGPDHRENATAVRPRPPAANRCALLEGGHLIWEDAPEEYAKSDRCVARGRLSVY